MNNLSKLMNQVQQSRSKLTTAMNLSDLWTEVKQHRTTAQDVFEQAAKIEDMGNALDNELVKLHSMLHKRFREGGPCIYRYATEGERRFARALIVYLVDRNYSISVFDGEEVTVLDMKNVDAVFHALATTGEDQLKCKRIYQDGRYDHFTFQLIWGNAPDGSELVADVAYARNNVADVNEILDEVTDIVQNVL